MQDLPNAPLRDPCTACAIRNRAICADLDNRELTLLNSIGRQRQLVAGQSLMWEGDEAVLVANVTEGVLKLSSHSAEGQEQILGLVYPSDFIGRPFGRITPYGVEALTDAHICVFQRKDFDRFASEHPRLEHKLLERTLSELDRSRHWMLVLGRMSASQKVASFLVEIADRLGSDQADGTRIVSLPLSRQQIADILGLTVETVSRQLTHLRDKGVISLPTRRDIILHAEGLKRITG